MAAREGLAATADIGAIEARLRAHTYRVASECDLQDAVAAVLAEIGPVREWIHGRDRPDFFLDGVAIEVKIDGSLSALTRQCHRYAQIGEVAAILVVTNRHRLAQLPEEMNGKPVRVVMVGSL